MNWNCVLNCLLLISLSSLVFAQDEPCPYTHDWEFSINATSGYQFFILEDNNVTTNASSLSIPILGFYDGSNCIQSNSTNLIIIPFNNSILVSTFYPATQSLSCAIFNVCNENDTCCSNGTVVFNVTDRPTCSMSATFNINYVYDTNSTYNLTGFFVTPTNHVTETTFITAPSYGEYTIDASIFTYQQTENYTLLDSFTIMICNEYGLCSNCSFNITGYHPPVCRDDSYVVTFTEDVMELTPLLNDSYVDFNQNFTFTGINITNFENTSGLFVPTFNGTVLYSHGTNYTTSDATIYTLCTTTLNLCDTCYIHLTIHSGITCDSDSYMIYSQTPTILDILTGDVDQEFPDTDEWVIVIESQFESGNATLLPNNTLLFTSSYILGNDTLIYTVIDPLGYNSTCEVAVEVLWQPVCGNTNYTVQVNSSSAINVTTFDSNPAGPILNTTLGLYIYSNVTMANGTVYVNGSFVMGVNYIAPINYIGDDSFIYRLCDSTMSCVNCTFNILIELENITTTGIVTTNSPTTGILVTTTMNPTTSASTTASPTTTNPTTSSITTANPTTAVITTGMQVTTGASVTISSPTSTTATSTIATTSIVTTRAATTSIPFTQTTSSSRALTNTKKLIIILVPVIIVVIGTISLIVALIMSCMNKQGTRGYERLELGRLPTDSEYATSGGTKGPDYARRRK